MDFSTDSKIRKNTEKISVIFLDIDGVIVPISSNYEFCAEALESLFFIIQETKARIVLSSTWRTSTNSVMMLNRKFAEIGFGPIFSVTPSLWRGLFIF